MPESSLPLSGIICAFWTPTSREGAVLWDAFDHNLRFVLDRGAHGIMALGSTAEFPHFELALRKQILERITAACRARGNLPVIANISHVSCRAAIELACHAKTCGASVGAVLPPWFFPAAQRDLAEFFIQVGRQSDLPLGLYNFPEVTGKRIEKETIRKVANTVKVAAVKQSGAEFDYHRELLDLGKALGFPVLTGADTRLPETLKMGCAGTVSGLANVVPDFLRAIYDSHQLGKDAAKPAELVTRIAEKMKRLLFPLDVKAVMEARGLETGEPKNPLSDETRRVYEEVVASVRELFEDHRQ